MIDWVSFRIPCTHPKEIVGDVVTCTDGAMTKVNWHMFKRLPVRGSFESSIQVRTFGSHLDGTKSMLEIDGNPLKWLQGHNVFGTDDLHGLILGLMDQLIEPLGLTPTNFERTQWQAGVIELTRVDCTGMYALESRGQVRAWIRAAEYTSKTRHGRPSSKGGTLYWGKNSRRWALKAYSKGDELEAGKKQHGLSYDLPHRGQLLQFADNKLRMELVLRAMELKEMGLSLVTNWEYHTPTQLLQERIGRIEMSEQLVLPPATLEALPGRLVGAYHLWKEGHDLRAMYPRRTFYNYRSALLKHGIDINIRQPYEDRSNVVPLVRILEARPVGVPEWAHGTPLYYEPRKHG